MMNIEVPTHAKYRITFKGFVPVEINALYGCSMTEGAAVENAVQELLQATWYRRERFTNPIVEVLS